MAENVENLQITYDTFDDATRSNREPLEPAQYLWHTQSNSKSYYYRQRSSASSGFV